MGPIFSNLSVKCSFPYQYIYTNKFGRIFRPYVTISVLKKDSHIYVNRTLIVDTGADFTVFPRSNAQLFGINLEKETTKTETFGVGGGEEIFLYKNLKIKIHDFELEIPVGFLNRNDVPPLLGRQQCLELFSVTFSDNVTTFKK